MVLVREWDQQMSGSGCCGRLEGEMTDYGGEKVFSERRAVMEQMGEIYRALLEAFPDQIEVEVIDPRNLIAYMGLFLRGQKMRNATWRDKIHQFAQGLSRCAVFVNGELLFSGGVPTAEEVIAAVHDKRKKTG